MWPTEAAEHKGFLRSALLKVRTFQDSSNRVCRTLPTFKPALRPIPCQNPTATFPPHKMQRPIHWLIEPIGRPSPYLR